MGGRGRGGEEVKTVEKNERGSVDVCAECPASLLCLTNGDNNVGMSHSNKHSNNHFFFHWCPMCQKNYARVCEVGVSKVGVPAVRAFGCLCITVPPRCPALSVDSDEMERADMMRVCEDCFVLYSEEKRAGRGWER